MGSAEDYIMYREFVHYGGVQRGTISLQRLVAMSAENGELIARVEDSGCEGTYCEVAAWNDRTHRFERLAFYKFLGGEFKSLTARDAAAHCAQLINEASAAWNVKNQEAPLIHNMPTFDSFSATQECQALVKIEAIMSRHLKADGSWTPLTAAEQRSILNEARWITTSPKMAKEIVA